MPNEREANKQGTERHYAEKAVGTLPGLSVSKSRSMAPPAPDVEVTLTRGDAIAVECRRYGETAARDDETRQYCNATSARRLTIFLKDRFVAEFGEDLNLMPCPRYKVGPNSTDAFIPEKVWVPLADELVEAAKESGLKPGPLFMGFPAMSKRPLAQEHLASFSLLENVFFEDNYVTTRATLEEDALIRIIAEKDGKTHDYNGDIWLLVHIGETGTSWPSTSLAKEAVHEGAANALATSHFKRMLVFDNFRVASLREDGRYDVYP